MKGAILTGLNEKLEIADDLETIEPRAKEVKVKVHTSGVCHSDLSVINGTLPQPMPCVLGHEGAGVVEAVGEGVTSVKPGDHVVMAFVPACGECYFCKAGQPYVCETAGKAVAMGSLYDGTPAFLRNGSPVRQMSATGTFAEYTVVPEGGAVKIDESIPLESAALVGCGVTTGVGAVLNTAGVKPGSSVAVVGTGGVGLNVIQGAIIAGAEQVIAVDLLDNKLEMAKSFGATDVVNASEGDPVTGVQQLTEGRGVDYAFEVIGFVSTMDQAYRMTRNGGETIFVGVPRLGEALNLMAAFILFQAKTIKGCWYGGASVQTDMPKYLGFYTDGKLKLDELITREFALEEVNEAIDAMVNGEVARGVINF